MTALLSTSTILLASLCLAGAAGYVVGSWKSLRPLAVVSKIGASTSFVAIAVHNGAAATNYGRAILTALIFSWVGDVLLLSRRSHLFLTGIAAFLAAHIAFSVAFVTKAISVPALAIGLVLTSLFAALILRWLWVHVRRPYRLAVALYVAAVMVMVSLAFGASGLSLPPTVGIGAVAFALSDISVARDRFIERAVANKAWGLPLYYVAQVLFAASVMGVR